VGADARGIEAPIATVKDKPAHAIDVERIHERKLGFGCVPDRGQRRLAWVLVLVRVPTAGTLQLGELYLPTLNAAVFAPASSLTKIYMSQEDMADIRHRLPFVLTSDDIPEYNILYVGQQPEDELHCYVFDIAPKKIEGKKRYFQGRVWVDDHDFQIVKTYGKTVPDLCNNRPCNEVKRRGDQENLFPKFTTWRQQIDGQYWFPVYTKADDELHFKMEDVHIKEIVKYEDYKRFGSNVKILYQGKEIPKGEQKPDQTAPDQKKPQ